MNADITYSNCIPLRSRNRAIHGVIDGFRDRLQLDAARVRVERRDEGGYPFRIHAHLVIPGPDITAEGADFTFEAALRKVSSEIRQRLVHRDTKRRSRRSPQARRRAPGR